MKMKCTQKVRGQIGDIRQTYPTIIDILINSIRSSNENEVYSKSPQINRGRNPWWCGAFAFSDCGGVGRSHFPTCSTSFAAGLSLCPYATFFGRPPFVNTFFWARLSGWPGCEWGRRFFLSYRIRFRIPISDFASRFHLVRSRCIEANSIYLCPWTTKSSF